MINALIRNRDQTAVLKLPDDPFNLQYDLSQIGIRSRLRDISINDDEDSDIQVWVSFAGRTESCECGCG